MKLIGTILVVVEFYMMKKKRTESFTLTSCDVDVIEHNENEAQEKEGEDVTKESPERTTERRSLFSRERLRVGDTRC